MTDDDAYPWEGMELDPLTWLQGWFASQCDGRWEQDHGIRIETLDNPGWSVEVDLRTPLRQSAFAPVARERSSGDWVHARVEGAVFRAACGPINLAEAIELLQRWVSRGTSS